MNRGWVASPEYRVIVMALRSARSEMAVSQRELAKRLGKPPSFINKIELLERRVDVLEFIAIARALGLDASELLKTATAALPSEIRL